MVLDDISPSAADVIQCNRALLLSLDIDSGQRYCYY